MVFLMKLQIKEVHLDGLWEMFWRVVDITTVELEHTVDVTEKCLDDILNENHLCRR